MMVIRWHQTFKSYSHQFGGTGCEPQKQEKRKCGILYVNWFDMLLILHFVLIVFFLKIFFFFVLIVDDILIISQPVNKKNIFLYEKKNIKPLWDKLKNETPK